jgi:hypothetical protein
MYGPLGEVTESDPVALAAFIGNQRTEHHVPHRVTCRVLGVSESWFYKWRDKPATAREIRRGRLADEIKRIFDDSGGTYGSPKIWITLVREGWRVSVNTVARIMAELGLAGRKIRRRRGPTRPGRRAAAPDFVHRDFTADAPDQVWCGNMTEIETGEGKLYLATVIDLFSRRRLIPRSLPTPSNVFFGSDRYSATASALNSAEYTFITMRDISSSGPSRSSLQGVHAQEKRPGAMTMRRARSVHNEAPVDAGDRSSRADTLRVMTEQVISLAWRWTAETSSDSAHRFCRIRVTAPPGEIGDPDAWSVVGLVQGAIDGMLKKLAPQPVLHAAAGMGAATLFADLHAWHSEGRRTPICSQGLQCGGVIVGCR